jgi:hypothetical protein
MRDIQGAAVPDRFEEFVERYAGPNANWPCAGLNRTCCRPKSRAQVQYQTSILRIANGCLMLDLFSVQSAPHFSRKLGSQVSTDGAKKSNTMRRMKNEAA